MNGKCPKCGGDTRGEPVGSTGWWSGHSELDCLHRQLAADEAKLDRMQEYGLSTKDYGDGDAQALWGRIDDFREDADASLSAEDVRELAEWWAELHHSLFDLDDKLCAKAERVKTLEKTLGDFVAAIETSIETPLTKSRDSGFTPPFHCYYCHFESYNGSEFKNPARHKGDCTYRLLALAVQQTKDALDAKETQA